MLLKILVFWILTIVASFIMETVQELRMFKDVADCGYKINVDKLKEYREKLGQKNPSLLWLLAPGYNIMKVIENTINYNKVRPVLLDQLNVMDALDELSTWELNEYKKKPTSFNAIIVPIKYKFQLENSISVKMKGGSKIYYTLFESKKISKDNIDIIKVEGPASRLNVDEQKN